MGENLVTDRQRYRKLYWCWKAIKQRCLNPQCRVYHNYGGRGITVCDEWLDFEPFLAWALSAGWKDGLEIDRINNDGNYSPDNCRFVTRMVNDNNKRTNTFISVDGETRTLSQWSRVAGINKATISRWMREHGSDYTSERIAESMRDGYVARDYNRNHKTIPVIHIESGMRFESIRRAAKHFKVNTGQLYNAVKHGHNTHAGHFVAAERI